MPHLSAHRSGNGTRSAMRVDFEDVLDPSISRRNQKLRSRRVERKEGYRLVITDLSRTCRVMDVGLQRRVKPASRCPEMRDDSETRAGLVGSVRGVRSPPGRDVHDLDPFPSSLRRWRNRLLQYTGLLETSRFSISVVPFLVSERSGRLRGGTASEAAVARLIRSSSSELDSGPYAPGNPASDLNR